MLVKELRELLTNLPDNMLIGVTYPDDKILRLCTESVDIRSTRVTDWFDGNSEAFFVIEVY